MKTDLVTVAIPVFERIDFFIKAIESVLNQTIVPKILVVDNNSSHQIFENYCKEKNIEYFKNDKNIGVFGNWNRGFEFAQSEFVLILSDDDYLDKNYIETFIERYKQFPNIDLFFTDFLISTYPTLSLSAHSHVIPFGHMGNCKTIQEYGIVNGLSFPVFTSIIRKSKFKGFYKEEHGSNDWEWIYLNTNKLSFFGEDSKMVFRGNHGNNDSSNINTQMRTSLSMSYIYNELVKNTEDASLKKMALRRSQNTFVYFLYLVNNSMVNELLKSELKYSKHFVKQFKNYMLCRLVLKLPYKIKRKLIGFFIYAKIIKL